MRATIDGRRIDDFLTGRQGRLLFAYLVLHRLRASSRVEGRSDLRLNLPDDAWVDAEAAAGALHRTESAVAREDWADAWVAARIALHIAARPFLAGDEAPWIEERRRDLEGIHIRATEFTARASLEIGGSELDTAERAARSLIRVAPFRESGYRYLMQVLAARENPAEALHVYEQLRRLLREELGVAPSPGTQQLHRRLLA